MNFTFGTSQIIFGSGVVSQTTATAAQYGKRILLVTGASSVERSGVLQRLEEDLSQADLAWVRWQVPHEPDVPLVDQGARLCREERCDVVLGLGGGSALDAAKAVASLATNPGSVIDYLENIPGSAGLTIQRKPLPLICVPTTAGTGTEATRNAVIRVPEARVKRSMRHRWMLPQVAIVDPELAANAPLSVSAAAGFDALTHLMEAYVSRGAQPLTDAIAMNGIRRSVSALWALAQGEATASTWNDLALASLSGGIALANAGLGAVHGLVAPLGGRYPVPHGAGCAILLPPTLRMNAAKLQRTQPSSDGLRRLNEVAAIILPDENPSPEAAAAQLDRLRQELGIPSLMDYGVSTDGFNQVIAGSKGSSMRYNPVELTDEELKEILAAAL